jgi:uncharacterized RDD family membrane protein YckC
MNQQTEKNLSSVTPLNRLLAHLLENLLGTVTLGIGWVIWAIVIVDKSQTPAKRLMKQRVIKKCTNKPASIVDMIIMRGFVANIVAAVLIVLTLSIILFMPFWDKNNENIWDKVSGTKVVDDPNDAWGLEKTN